MSFQCIGGPQFIFCCLPFFKLLGIKYVHMQLKLPGPNCKKFVGLDLMSAESIFLPQLKMDRRHAMAWRRPINIVRLCVFEDTISQKMSNLHVPFVVERLQVPWRRIPWHAYQTAPPNILRLPCGPSQDSGASANAARRSFLADGRAAMACGPTCSRG